MQLIGELYTKYIEIKSNLRARMNSSSNLDLIRKVDELLLVLQATGRSMDKRNRSTGLEFEPYLHHIEIILEKVYDCFLYHESMLLDLHGAFKIIGDIHGQFHDLEKIFHLSGTPSADNKFLFLGDYVDRGLFSLETILYLFCLKIKYPTSVYLLRGNHESATINKVYGFFDECKRRLGRHGVKVWKAFCGVFNTMPVAAKVNQRVLCMHGGLSPELFDLEQINGLLRPTDIPETGLLCDLVWSDPKKNATYIWDSNDRGVSYTFSEEAVYKFCATHNLELIVRAHQVVEDGYEFFAERKLVTIFSAPNYTGEFDNAGAFLSIGEDLFCSIVCLKTETGGKGGKRKGTDEQYVRDKFPESKKLKEEKM